MHFFNITAQISDTPFIHLENYICGIKKKVAGKISEFLLRLTDI